MNTATTEIQQAKARYEAGARIMDLAREAGMSYFGMRNRLEQAGTIFRGCGRSAKSVAAPVNGERPTHWDTAMASRYGRVSLKAEV